MTVRRTDSEHETPYFELIELKKSETHIKLNSVYMYIHMRICTCFLIFFHIAAADFNAIFASLQPHLERPG
jgi:hypothetical protein